MTWNYRIVKDKCGNYTIREVYYGDLEHINAWTENPCHPFGETYEELCADIRLITRALQLPVLDEEKLPK